MDVYKSKNSEYYIKDGNLIRENDLEDHNWGKLWVYVSVENLRVIAKERQIKVLKRPALEESVATEFMNVLQDKKMNPSEVGGRIFALRKTERGYIPCWSGKITKIRDYKAEIKVIK